MPENDDLEAARGRGVRTTVIFVMLFITFVVAAFVYRIQQPRLMSMAEMKVNGAYVLDTPRNIGEINLIDQNGRAFTKERFEGMWTLVFFGFTHCPDVCPTTMAFLNEFIQNLEGTEAEDTPHHRQQFTANSGP